MEESFNSEVWKTVRATVMASFDRYKSRVHFSPGFDPEDLRMHVLEHFADMIHKDPATAEHVMQSDAFVAKVIKNAATDYLRLYTRLAAREVASSATHEHAREDTNLQHVLFVVAFKSLLSEGDLRYAALKVLGHSDAEIQHTMGESGRQIRNHKESIKLALEELRG